MARMNIAMVIIIITIMTGMITAAGIGIGAITTPINR